MKIHLFIFTMFMLIWTSCKTQKNDLTYFDNLSSKTDTVINSNDFNIKIIPNDELLISVSSLIPEATAGFNLPMVNPATKSTLSLNTQPQIQTYVVNKQGYINFPTLGKLKVDGMTTNQLTDYLTKEISKTVDDPMVRVELVNFKVNVIGEVKTPGMISVHNERYTILDAIAQAGDLTEFGRRENVLLIRETNGKKIIERINLNDSKLLNSPYYYLQQNDVIYIEPNKIKKDNSKYNQNNAFKLSVISTIVSACSVIASLVIALTIK